ncbi:diacylglycerol/lipid kinase family protein [Halococcus saccharolyticus]|uniref:Diacylglycerol kinase catalytic subunit n=1 Tax=Halococcus saccharolyticus DSM 5350 TaxID=1227455 RepID=M0MED9_9EURY|nr:YegS/Rv2252/BmrU family lipid kinase [Halococcus saccharolyticus]EMA44096.1 diacylglycerol kinase catalytic subunit [Halococcus saccharolyticus DSM 5350]
MTERSALTTPTRRRSIRADGGHATDVGIEASRVLVLNPVSGSADHTERIHELAADHDFTVRETNEAGDAIDFAREAADADLVAAAGGDGTIHEVVRGLYDADALDSTTVGVVPTGTGNNFAGNVGVDDVEEAFAVLETGDTRAIDLGIANGRPFVNSAIAGLTADASSETTADMKDSFGVLAYVMNTVQTAASFEGLTLDVETAADEESWRGEAAFVLIGNGRRFPVEGHTQADMEDGRFEVTIIENRPTGELVGEAAIRRLLGTDTSNITRLDTTSLSVSVRDGEPGTFSLDGEMLSARDLDVETAREALSIRVGEGYEIDPEPLD